MIAANNPNLRSWVDVPENSDFPIQNLPFGIFETGSRSARAGVAIGDSILDLAELASRGYLVNLDLDDGLYAQAVLNPLMRAAGKQGMRKLRNRLSSLLDADSDELKSSAADVDAVLVPMSDARMLMPVHVGDYTDFYSSEQHAFNVGCMFRDPDNALMPNWKHLPVGYHGRASSIIVSGEPIRRPQGQTKADDADNPVFGPSKLLDFELEMGFITFDGKPMGEVISTAEAEEYIFGLCLFNDWSARDVQKWEYVPLGPFLAKNFASSLSPWIVTLDALEPFRVAGPEQDPEVLPYLKQQGDNFYDVSLDVIIETPNGEENVVSQSNLKHMYWSMVQQLAHHTCNGCNMRAGDLLASGTISGDEPSAYGSMLELSWRGSKPLSMKDGTERRFILDGDTVIMRGHGIRDGVRIGFGEVRTRVLD